MDSNDGASDNRGMRKNAKLPKVLGKTIQERRKDMNLTQEELADKLEVSRQTINAIESDKYLPSLGLAFHIANLFKIKIEDIFIYTKEDTYAK